MEYKQTPKEDFNQNIYFFSEKCATEQISIIIFNIRVNLPIIKIEMKKVLGFYNISTFINIMSKLNI